MFVVFFKITETRDLYDMFDYWILLESVKCQIVPEPKKQKNVKYNIDKII